MCNQIELHPYNSQTELVEFLLDNDIVPVAYSSLGNVSKSDEWKKEKVIEDPLIKKLAEKYKKSP